MDLHLWCNGYSAKRQWVRVQKSLVINFGIQVINKRPKTPRTQGLVEQSNGTVKIRINAWKRTNRSTH